MVEFLLMALLLGFVLLWITAVVDLFRHSIEDFASSGASKGGTFLGILLTGGLGGAYYWIVVRRRLRKAR